MIPISSYLLIQYSLEVPFLPLQSLKVPVGLTPSMQTDLPPLSWSIHISCSRSSIAYAYPPVSLFKGQEVETGGCAVRFLEFGDLLEVPVGEFFRVQLRNDPAGTCEIPIFQALL